MQDDLLQDPTKKATKVTPLCRMIHPCEPCNEGYQSHTFSVHNDSREPY